MTIRYTNSVAFILSFSFWSGALTHALSKLFGVLAVFDSTPP